MDLKPRSFFHLIYSCRIATSAIVVLLTTASSYSTPATTNATVRQFLGNVAGGKFLYTKWEGTTGYNNGRTLWYVDFSETTMVEHQIINETSVQPMNGEISNDGKWAVYNTNHDSIFICQFKPYTQNTKIYICRGAQPFWWKSPSTGDEYIVCTGGDMMESWQNTWESSTDQTYMQKIDTTTKQPIGTRQVLLNHYASGGRSKAGGWLFASGRATGIYQISPTAITNASIIASGAYAAEWGCNPSVSPHPTDDSVLVMHNGAADLSTLGYENHSYFVIRKPATGQIIMAYHRNTADSNGYMDAPQWSTHRDFITYAASTVDMASPYDAYIFRIHDSTSLKILDGNYYWTHLWVDTSVSLPTKALHDNSGTTFHSSTPKKVSIYFEQNISLHKNSIVYDIYGRKIATESSTNNRKSATKNRSAQVVIVGPDTK